MPPKTGRTRRMPQPISDRELVRSVSPQRYMSKGPPQGSHRSHKAAHPQPVHVETPFSPASRESSPPPVFRPEYTSPAPPLRAEFSAVQSAAFGCDPLTILRDTLVRECPPVGVPPAVAGVCLDIRDAILRMVQTQTRQSHADAGSPPVHASDRLDHQLRDVSRKVTETDRRSAQRDDDIAQALEALAGDVDRLRRASDDRFSDAEMRHQQQMQDVATAAARFNDEVYAHVRNTASALDKGLQGIEVEAVRRDKALRGEVSAECQRAIRRCEELAGGARQPDDSGLQRRLEAVVIQMENDRQRLGGVEKQCGALRNDLMSVRDAAHKAAAETDGRCAALERSSADYLQSAAQGLKHQLDNAHSELAGRMDELEEGVRRGGEAHTQQVAGLQRAAEEVDRMLQSRHTAADPPGLVEFREEVLALRRSVQQCARGRDLDTLADEVEALKQRAKGEAGAKEVAALRQETAAIRQEAAVMREEAAAMREQLSGAAARIAESDSKADAAAAAAAAAADAAAAAAKKTDEAASELRETVGGVKGQVAALEQSGSQAGSAAAEAKALADELQRRVDGEMAPRQGLDEMAGRVDALEQELRRSDQRRKDSTAQAEGGIGDVRATLRETGEKLAEVHDDVDDLREQLQRQRAQQEELRSGLTELKGFTETSFEATDKKEKGWAERLLEIEKELHTSLQRYARQVDRMQEPEKEGS